MITRVSTYTSHLITIESLNRRQASLAEMQGDISSGVQFDTYSEVAQAGEMRRVVDFSSTLDRTGAYLRNNEIMRARMEVMDKNLGALENLTTEALRSVAAERSAVRSDYPLTAQMKALLQQVEDQLNSSSGGRYLFSGADTAVRPVNSLLQTNINADGEATDNYYNGDGTDLSQKVSDDVSIQYNVRANDPVFQKLIGALHRAIDGEASNSDVELAQAIDELNEARQGLNGIRNTIGNNLGTLETVNKQHDNFKTYYKNTLGEIVGTDVAETSIQLALDQSILTASFQTFARVSNLTLSQYLR